MRRSATLLSLAAATLLVLSACSSSRRSGGGGLPAYRYEIQKKVLATKGAVVSAHPLASQVGLQILKKGGNAVDAAIATQLALAVVYPNAGNIGGGGFMVARLQRGDLLALDYRETAPAASRKDMYLDAQGNPLPDKSQNGHLSSGVPGTVAGLFAAHRHAKLPFATLIGPAIELAEKGFAITEREARSLNALQADLKRFNTREPVFIRAQWKSGDTLIQKDLAATLRRIRDGGAAGFYEGETARLIEEEMQRGGGILTREDLRGYQAKYREAHRFNYKGYEIVGMPMPSSGGVLLHQMMKMTEPRNIGALGFHSAEAVQLMTEIMRRAFADRAYYMGDPDYTKVPVGLITADFYLTNRMKDYDSSKPTPSSRIGPGRVLQLATESEETTHLSVLDQEGNAVAVTTTLNNSYGSRTVVGGAGFFLNDEMDDFSISPGVPNMYGAIGGEANSIQAGKRMLSSMTPTLVLKDGKPHIVIGTPGGTTIPTQIYQTLLNLLEFGLSTEDAVYKPKFHHQWMPDELVTEKGFSSAVLSILKRMGYPTGKERGGIGRTEIIRVRPDGKIEAVADFRGDDSAAGY